MQLVDQPNSSTLGIHLDDDDGGVDRQAKHQVYKASGRQRGFGCTDTTRPADLPDFEHSWHPLKQPRKKETSFTQLLLHDAQRKQSGIGCTDSNFEPEAKPIDPAFSCLDPLMGGGESDADDEEDGVEVEADYPKPRTNWRVDDYADAFELLGLDQLAIDEALELLGSDQRASDDEAEDESGFGYTCPRSDKPSAGTLDLAVWVSTCGETERFFCQDPLMSGGESDARKSKLTELDAEVLEMLGLDQLASDDEEDEVEVDADYPKPLPEGMVDDDDYAEALKLLGLDQLASDDEEDEVEVEADYPKLLPEVMDDDYAEALKRLGLDQLAFAEDLELLGLDQLASDARNCKLPELDAEVLEMLGSDQLASDDEDDEVEVDADYPKPLPEGMVEIGRAHV